MKVKPIDNPKIQIIWNIRKTLGGLFDDLLRASLTANCMQAAGYGAINSLRFIRY